MDLGSAFVITRIVIYNRQDFGASFLTNFVVTAGTVNPASVKAGTYDVSANPTCASFGASDVRSVFDFQCAQPAPARFVAVALKAPSTYLQLCEVQVRGWRGWGGGWAGLPARQVDQCFFFCWMQVYGLKP